jgi:hypothetical protein
MARKPRVDSTAVAVQIMIKSTRDLQPPEHAPLVRGAEPFWNEILEAKARSEWNDHDLSCASDLANAMALLVENRRKLVDEGEILANAAGTAMVNPRVSVVHGLHAQIKSARQSLCIHGQGAAKTKDVQRHRAEAKKIEAGNPLEGNDLLARPDVIN